eukprot:COSAG06_NODE_1179_length_10388_cov_7.454563_5_plen_91_part_00
MPLRILTASEKARLFVDDRGAMMWTRAQAGGGVCWVMVVVRPPRLAEVVACGRPVASAAPTVLPTSTAPSRHASADASRCEPRRALRYGE